MAYVYIVILHFNRTEVILTLLHTDLYTVLVKMAKWSTVACGVPLIYISSCSRHIFVE